MFHSLFTNIYYVFSVSNPAFFVYLNGIGREAIACMQLPCKKATVFGCCYLLLQKTFAVLWVMIPQNEASEPSDEMSPVQGVGKT